jgi:hypothetical protein
MTQWYDIDTWQWADSPDYEWGATSSGSAPSVTLNQIFVDEAYVYVAKTSGLSIVSVETGSEVNSINIYQGYNSIWASDNNVYLGTFANGIEYFNKSQAGVVSYTSTYAYYNSPDISSNNVKYIHGNSDKLIISTDQGIDIIRRNNYYITHNLSITSCNKTFVTPNYDYYYYTYYDGYSYKISRLNGNKSDWSTPDVEYTTGFGFLVKDTIINDFYVTEHTSTLGVNNTLFVITDSAAYVCDEGTKEVKIFTTYSGVYDNTVSGVHNIIGGTSTNFVAIWADSNTSINYGKVYIASTGEGAALSVIDTNTDTLYDCYTENRKGASNDMLADNNIKDIDIEAGAI